MLKQIAPFLRKKSRIILLSMKILRKHQAMHPILPLRQLPAIHPLTVLHLPEDSAGAQEEIQGKTVIRLQEIIKGAENLQTEAAFHLRKKN